MSDIIGPRNVAPPGGAIYNSEGGSIPGDILQARIDKEVDRIIGEQYERGMRLLTENKDVLDAIAKFLIEEEKIDGNQLLQLIKNIKPDLVDEEAINAVASITKPKGLAPIPETA